MPTMRYNVTQPPLANVFAWITSGEIAIPEIQRPFVWNTTKVRNLLDSLFRGYPIGYLIAWKNPDVKLKDGTPSAGKRILIDGQQRVTALMAALLARTVVNKDYQRQRIRIAFHPLDDRFEVTNPAIEQDKAWIPDIAPIFAADTGLLAIVDGYCAANHGANKDAVLASILRLKGITGNQIGIIDLDPDLDIETVTEIFIRVNSEGVPLSQADFAMSKIAVNETYGGSTLRKAIDYFCHLAKSPDFFALLQRDKAFVQSPLYPPLAWMKSENDDLYDPSYTDMLRVALAAEFNRGRLEDLVALLSGRNFETKEYEDAIVQDTFARLHKGVLRFMNETNFKRFLMILRSAGFVDSALIGSQNAVNFAYVLFLWLRERNVPSADIERHVRRWFVMSMLTERYSNSPESAIDYDIRQMEASGFERYADSTYAGALSDAFWDTALPLAMNTSSTGSPYWRVFLAAQVEMNDRGFLSQKITVKDLIEVKADVHHIFPRDILKKQGMTRGQYNQIANLAVAQSEINIAIGNKPPEVYFKEIYDQCRGGPKRYGNIVDKGQLALNFRENCIPESIAHATVEEYPQFLAERRLLMAQKIKTYFQSL